MTNIPKATNDLQFKELFSDFLGSNTEDEVINLLLSFSQLQSYYQCAMMEIETKFRVLNEEFSLRYDSSSVIVMPGSSYSSIIKQFTLQISTSF